MPISAAEFELSTEQLCQIADEFTQELRLGLQQDGKMLRALPTYVTRLPSGEERGEFLVVDFGGSNLRVGCVQLSGDGKFKLDRLKWQLTEELKRSTGIELFGFIAGRIRFYLEGCPDDSQLKRLLGGAPGRLGFTFSYPVRQESLAHGVLIQWNKALECDDVVGVDVVQLLQSALHRIGLDNIEVAVLLNDTVGTLVAHSYADPDTKVGVILGTGTNAAYVERIAQVNKLASGADDDDDKMVINVEWGAFGEASEEEKASAGRSSTLLPITDIDRQVDAETMNPGKQPFEKMVSGMYLGEIARLLLEKVCKTQLGTPFSLEAVDLSNIAETDELSVIREIVKRRLPEADLADSSLGRVKHICSLVAQRSANLCAAAIVGIYKVIGSPKERTVVAFDGSVYKNYPGYPRMLADATHRILPNHSMVFQMGTDESIIGAAVVLAAL